MADRPVFARVARTGLVLAGPLLLAGCGGGNEQAGGVTAEEARALDEAAEMIDSRRLPDEALARPQPAPASASEAPPPKR